MPDYYPYISLSADDPDFAAQLGGAAQAAGGRGGAAAARASWAIRCPPDVDAVVFPQMLGEAYRRLEQFKALGLPVLVITSEFGTVSMWDWEINQLPARREGCTVIAPYDLDAGPPGLPPAGAANASCAAPNSSSTRTTPARASRPASSSASTGGKRSAPPRLKERFGAADRQAQLPRAGRTRPRPSPTRRPSRPGRTGRRRCPWTSSAERALLLSAVKLYLAVKRDLDGRSERARGRGSTA